MFRLSHDWLFDVDVSPDWLFIRIRNSPDDQPTGSLAEGIWALAQQRSIFQFVVELHEDVLLTSDLIGQLILLHKRSCMMGGTTRLCGFSQTNYQSIQTMQLAERFPNYRTREEAVMGCASHP